MSTSTPIFDPEDPKLTAYALGELTDPAKCAEVERLLQHSPQAQIAVQEIKDTVLILTAEYDQERRTASEPVSPLNSKIIDLANRPPERRWSWVGPLLAAAAILLAVVSVAALIPGLFQGHTNHKAALRSPSTPMVTEIEPAPDETPAPAIAAAAPVDAASAAASPESLEAMRGKLAMLDKEMTKFRMDRPEMRVDSVLEAKPATPIIPPGETSYDLRQSEVGANFPTVSSTPQVITAVPPAGGAIGEGVLGAGLSTTQPNKGEYQRYPGHPATNSLGELSRSRPTFSGGGSLTRDYDVNSGIISQSTAPTFSGGGSLTRDYDVNSGIIVRSTAQPAAPATAAKPQLARVFRNDTSFYRTTQGLNDDEVDTKRLESAARSIEETSKKESSRDKSRRNVSPAPEFDTAAYDHLVENAFLAAKEEPLSTFSIDVDTASYANVRRFIEGGSLPPAGAVRVEEMINYFPYDYAPPAADSDKPFAVHLEGAACPWAPEHRLVRVGIKGKEVAVDKRPASNLVFLLDVSGSMNPSERLPLIKKAMSMMVEHLTDNDRVAIVTYAGNSGLVLPSTDGAHKDDILAALDRLQSGGSTNGASGIELAYRTAKENFIKGGTNRVILATDGDFNVGVTNQGDLVTMIQEQAKSGVFLSVLGVGTDNFKDSTMQKLADKGNGNYNYLDRLEEARKVLVDQMGGTLVAIAKDVKIQVEFNPAVVGSYRLIGYEKRMLRKEDFNNDKIDAGEIGAGHSVTALYEVVPVGQPTPQAAPAVDTLKYGPQAVASATPAKTEEAVPAAPAAEVAARKTDAPVEMLTVKMRHKAPDADKSERTYEVPLNVANVEGDFSKASVDFRFAAAVAEFGLVLRDSPYKGSATFNAAVELAQESKGPDPKGYRAGFVELVRKAQSLKDGRQG